MIKEGKGLIQLKNVSKFYYSKGMIASGISKVNLEFDIGEFVVITGESGSGKTTLLNVISGLDSYEEGEMYINGEETSHYLASDFEDYRKKYIGNIFQNFNLVNSYTVYQNVELILRVNGYRRADMKKRISDIIEKVGLTAYVNTKVSKLSGGQKQRTAIARALAKDTDIIVADEPTGNLDSESAQGISQLLSDISHDKLVIVVTHNYDQFAAYATRKIKMHDGKVAEDNEIRRAHEAVSPSLQSAGDEAASVRAALEAAAAAGTDDEPKPKAAAASGAAGADAAGYINAGSILRLGTRNTFNIVFKFILLLIVFVFVVTAVTAQYTTYKRQDEEAASMGFNVFFMNYSEDRMVLKKSDTSEFTDDDIGAIKNVANVKSVAPDDILLDSSVYLENSDMSYEVYPRTMDEFDGELAAGRMPEKKNEVIITGAKDDYYFTDDVVDTILNKKYGIVIGEDAEFKATVVGIAYKEDSDSAYYYTGDIFIGDDMMAEMIRETYSYVSDVEVNINGTKLQSDASYYRVMPNSHVDKGEVLMSEEADNFYKSGNAKGNTIKISAENIYYDKTIKLEITDTYTEKTFTDKTGIKSYEDYMGVVLINSADYDRLFARGNYQISVYVDDVKEMEATEDALQNMGYTTMALKDYLYSYGDSDLLSIIQVPMVVIIILALFFISYFVIRLILRSRTEYFSILRMLGLSKNKVRRILDVEMFMVVNIAFAIFLLMAILTYYHVINIEYVQSLVEYLDVSDFVILYVVLIAMAYLISGKFVRSIFKKSAMGSFREVR